MKAKLTQQGLSSSLLDAMEFGFKARERGLTLEQARSEILPFVTELIDSCGNLPREILRIDLNSNSNIGLAVLAKE